MTKIVSSLTYLKQLKKYALMLGLLAVFLGVLVVPLEKEHQISRVGDGIWWAIVTVTDVGYGDYVPVTFWGRVVGVILMTTGVILFSLVVAILSSSVFHRENKYWRKRMKSDLDSINNKLYRMESKLEHLIKDKQKK